MDIYKSADVGTFFEAVVWGAALGCVSLVATVVFRKVPDIRRVLIELSESDEMWTYGAACGVAIMSFVTLLCRAMKQAMCIFKESRIQVDDVVRVPERAEEVSSEAVSVSEGARSI